MSWYEDIRNYYEELQEDEDLDFWDEHASTGDGIMLWEALELAAEAFPREFMTAEDLDEYMSAMAEREAELAVERSFEDAGWLDAYLEGLVESGLRARY